ncbi:MAG: hypothetical protein HZY76_20835 [Anaerolineae bacterium]|nr:MAG: hypothetical protein HZY76_20835 [Anaerolineae bacterium]
MLANLGSWLRRERTTWPDNTVRLYLPRFLISIGSLLLLIEAALAINWPTNGLTWALIDGRVVITAVEARR